MDTFEQQRRSFLMTMGGLGISQVLPQAITAQATTPQASVLSATEGEHLIHFRDHGNIFIKFGAATGSSDLAIGTQQVMTGTGIPIHRRFKMDEAVRILEGSLVRLAHLPHRHPHVRQTSHPPRNLPLAPLQLRTGRPGTRALRMPSVPIP
jgi:hypothetical protein